MKKYDPNSESRRETKKQKCRESAGLTTRHRLRKGAGDEHVNPKSLGKRGKRGAYHRVFHLLRIF